LIQRVPSPRAKEKKLRQAVPLPDCGGKKERGKEWFHYDEKKISGLTSRPFTVEKREAAGLTTL